MKRQRIDSARQLRRAQTEAEGILWSRLRSGRLSGLKFRRQHAIAPFIVDFACLSCRLIVELDGSQHAERTAQDEERSLFLSGKGFRVIRFWNRDVLTNLEGVLATILAECEEVSATM
jgi:very-short-patch-repair endonuclease